MEVPKLYADTFFHAFDAKHRITFPQPWREDGYEGHLFVANSKRGCLLVYPGSRIALLQAKASEVPIGDETRRQQFANFFGQLQNLSWDKQGRVMIKEEKLKFAGIKNKAVLRGAGDHVEIWSEEAWKAKQAKAAEQPMTFEDTAAALGM
ncbi:MAG: division/cell wall cluster transcriptional repressor MraZ [Verrucomicrobiae bacterium]|nr:division/cell wall cluster transcriptional repressor MraZ [Verrucomicrobiae bacterium]